MAVNIPVWLSFCLCTLASGASNAAFAINKWSCLGDNDRCQNPKQLQPCALPQLEVCTRQARRCATNELNAVQQLEQQSTNSSISPVPITEHGS